jgi:predicted phage terminase large subunit-like protein
MSRRSFLGMMGAAVPTIGDPPPLTRGLRMATDRLSRAIAESDERRAESPKLTLHEFMRQSWPIIQPTPFVDNWHLGCMCEHLEAVTKGQITDLLFNVPPGTAKTLTSAVFWPAHEWTLDPSLSYLNGSYDDLLTIKATRNMRELVESAWYQERWPLAFKRDQNTKTHIENVKNGWRFATSVGGGGTGLHPRRKLIDDPHNVKQSLSDEQRTSAITWFDLTMGSRGLSLNAATVIAMQRLHEKDLSGHVMEKLGRQFVIIVLPMRYEPPVWVEVRDPAAPPDTPAKRVPKPRMEKTPLGFQDPRKKPGELLWPALFDERKVAKLEAQLAATHGDFGIAGQLQQRPVPQKGGLIKREWFPHFVDAIPPDEIVLARVRGWDCAATEDGGDWTVGVKMAYCRSGRVYIEDVLAGQWGPETFEGEHGILKNTARLDGPRVRVREEQEGGSAGKKIIHAHQILLAGWDYEGTTVSGQSKVERNKPFRSHASQRLVILLRAAWNSEYLNILCNFPNGAIDDHVDATSVAFNGATLSNTGTGRVVEITGA